MHGITRCPQCQTAFKVDHKQLAKASGKVRCGVCKHPFIAADFWVVAEPDESELSFESAPIVLSKQHRRPWQTIMAATILLVGMLIGAAQWLHHFPASANTYPPMERLRQNVYRWLGQKAPAAIDWSALSLEHYVGQMSAQQEAVLRIQGLLVNRSANAQPAPDLKLTLWLANGETHAVAVPASRIVRKSEHLAAQRQSEFYFDIDKPSQVVERIALELCCQQKN
jgi:predicted Zn finger-like uncharacterized protein